jgi:ATP-dependent Lhr-like helicase
MAAYLVGADQAPCTIVDSGHRRERDLAMEILFSPLEAVMSNEVWGEIYDRLAGLAEAHRTTLIFVNTRRLAERVARFLAERLGEEQVTAHHGSLAREHRLTAEQRLKTGQLRALVATASLELGIDIGDVDLVCQLGSPRAIATFLQRVGRSGHALGAIPKGRLFPLSRDDLLECSALLDAVRRDELDRVMIPRQPLDVLAQQIVAEVASRDWDEGDLYRTLSNAWPYRDLERDTYTDVLRMLADGFSTRRGRRGAYLHRDAVNGQLRARRGARLTAITNGGAIPDQFDYDVVLSPQDLVIGNLNEDFAFESLPGDIFQLGNTSYRMLKIERGRVFVEDARGQPPNIPFWFGEAPGRTDELSLAVARLRDSLSRELDTSPNAARRWLESELGLPAAGAQQLSDYLAAAKAALGVLPSQETVVFERFFDETGDMHFVIHASFGSRINRAWGLALRKRFCRRFNFELQAAATEDNIILSLGPTHSFPLEEVAGYLKSASVRQLLIQALLDAPMFATRWRWDASIALAVRRVRNGKRVPAQFQRNDAEDLVAVVFPDQLACLENIAGDREVPDHPLVRQTIQDCLHDNMDIEGLETVLRRLERDEIRLVTRDLTGPSPLAQEILNARPYAFLDDAPAEERRTQAVRQRRFLDPQSAADLGRLDPAAIERVRGEAWPEPRSTDELHDALVIMACLTREEVRSPLAWQSWLEALAEARRATCLRTPSGHQLWVAAERLLEWQAIFPRANRTPSIAPCTDGRPGPLDREQAIREVVRSRLEGLGPVTASQLARSLDLLEEEVSRALLALEQEGFAVRGQFSHPDMLEWCERRLLARIHRYTLKRLRSEIEPVSAADFMRFLFRWQRLDGQRGEGADALLAVLSQLEGCAVQAAAWEGEVLPARLARYTSRDLDKLCASGRIVWLRRPSGVSPRAALAAEDRATRKAAPLRVTPIAIIERSHLPAWQNGWQPGNDDGLSSGARQAKTVLAQYGASFFEDLVIATGMLRTQVEEALAELVARGQVTADSFAGLRALMTPASRRPGFARRGAQRRRALSPAVDAAGRWSLVMPRQVSSEGDGGHEPESSAEHMALVLLRRYGIVFRKLLERENGLPPWRELLYVYRRLEARGEIRGGRFVEGFSGEQFALPEAVSMVRDIRRRGEQQAFVSLSALDPINLTGVITPGERVPAQAGNRVLYRDGVPVAMHVAGRTRFLNPLEPQAEWQARNLLLNNSLPAGFASSFPPVA